MFNLIGLDKSNAKIPIMDFASMILRNYNALAYVGGVVTVKDETMLRQFMQMVGATIAERQKAFPKP